MNFSQRFALNTVAVIVFAIAVGGCGAKDGTKEYEAGKVAYEVRDLAKAQKLFAKASELNLTNIDAYVMLAKTDLELGEIASAKVAIAHAAKYAGDDADIVALSARAAYFSKDYENASRLYRQIADDETIAPNVRSLAWAGYGIVEMTCENRDIARIAFLRAIRFDRRNASAWYHLGLLYRDAFRYYEASLEQFEIFVRLEAEADSRVQRVQRTVIPALKDDIARKKSEVAPNRDSQKAGKLIAEGDEAKKKNTFKTARLRYAEALKADPLSYPAALGVAECAAKVEKDKKIILDAYLVACKLAPGRIKTFITTGDIAYAAGQWATAVEVYSRAVASDPANLTAIDGLIRSLRKVGGKNKIAAAYQSYRDSIPVKRK